MALNLSRCRKRWVCRAAGRGASCRHFHVHYHVRRQVRAFSPLQALPPSLLHHLLILPVMYLAVLAFLVCFGWFTLVYFLSSLLRNASSSHECFKGGGDGGGDGASCSNEHSGEDGNVVKEQERVVNCVAEPVGDSAVAEVCDQKLDIKELFVDSSEGHRLDACISDHDELADDEKLVLEVVIFDTDSEVSEEISSPDVYSEKDQVSDIPIDWFSEERNIIDFQAPCSTEKFLDVLYGEEFVAKRKEVSGYASSETFDLVDKHETRALVIDGAGSECDFKIEELASSNDLLNDGHGDEHKKQIKHEQSIRELPVNKIHGNVLHGGRETGNSVNEHNSRLQEIQAENVSLGDDGRQRSGTSGEAHDAVTASFHQACRDQCDKQEQQLIEKRVDPSSSASTDCESPDNLDIIAEPDRSAVEDTIGVEASEPTSVQVRVENGVENADDIRNPTGGSQRLPGLQRSPTQWWNLCGVLDVLGGCED